MNTAMVEVNSLGVSFGSTRVLHDVSLRLEAGQTIGVVGESGSGKSTLAKVLVGIVAPDAGSVVVDAFDVRTLGHSQRAAFRYRRRVQMIPQDPFSSLSPRRTVGQTLAEALDPVWANVRRFEDRIAFWLERVGLPADAMNRYPHEFSGGQRQRVAIARSLILEPSVVIADEITSALDVSVQVQILEMIAEIKDELNVTMMFISHNLAVVQSVSDMVAVMYQGEIVEIGSVEQIYSDPQHWYTKRLLDADPGAPGFSLEWR
ncbi:ABC transporter ATP-binding protein [Gryllotalpicola koreensis]|uniref:ABC transporter domain-containing protein n=1 Tax=Gryllotalpicola koreensis TaxID=993086 RepID=A0ABP7ZSY5_9MICO